PYPPRTNVRVARLVIFFTRGTSRGALPGIDASPTIDVVLVPLRCGQGGAPHVQEQLRHPSPGQRPTTVRGGGEQTEGGVHGRTHLRAGDTGAQHGQDLAPFLHRTALEPAHPTSGRGGEVAALPIVHGDECGCVQCEGYVLTQTPVHCLSRVLGPGQSLPTTVGQP